MSISSKLNLPVFLPAILILTATTIYSLVDNERFLALATQGHQWVLAHFGYWFTWSSFLFLGILLIVYISPMGKWKIGGADAEPILSRWRWFSIALCTTVATGILFWGTAEPLYHLHTPPEGLQLPTESRQAARFAMSTMFMHWSFTPYGIYTIMGLIFTLVYYNLKQPFRISSLLVPLLGQSAHGWTGTLLDIVCLYALVLGMAASLGTGIFALMGGLENTLQLPQSDLMLGLIGLAIVGAFIVSAVSGLHKGIKILSDYNMRAFFVLAGIVLLLGPATGMVKIGGAGLGEYLSTFFQRSTNWGGEISTKWQNDWTIFYFANWFAWAPVASLFLGRLGVGYSVRNFIQFNLILPSLFTWGWMIIFSGGALSVDMNNDGMLYNLMQEGGEEVVMYALFDSFSFGGTTISLFALVIVFISYVTAADSNISAMSSMSSQGISPDNPEAPIFVKIIWGLVIGTIAWVMITGAGIDGIRLLCVLGGFPAMFLTIGGALGLLKWLIRSK